MNHEIIHAIIHALVDTAQILPLLFLAYLLMEYLEHHSASKLNRLVVSSRKAGPFLGALVGLVPQCGFSGAASNFYAGGAVTMGTLIAVYLSTSDEMLPILASTRFPVWKILVILGVKFICGMIVGFIVDWVIRRHHKESKKSFHSICERDHCACERGGILFPALKHTVKVGILILVVLGVLGIAFLYIPQEKVAAFCNVPILGEVVFSLIGLIPNCAASVMITNLYVQNVIGAGPMLAGLFTNAGLGLLVLFRVNRNWKENFTITGILVCTSILLGILLGPILGLIL